MRTHCPLNHLQHQQLPEGVRRAAAAPQTAAGEQVAQLAVCQHCCCPFRIAYKSGNPGEARWSCAQ